MMCIGPFKLPFNALNCRYRLQVSVSEVGEGYTGMRDTTHGQENILLVFSNKKKIDLSTTQSTSYAIRAYAYYNHAHAEIWGDSGYHSGNYKYLHEKGEATRFQPLEGSVAENYGDLWTIYPVTKHVYDNGEYVYIVKVDWADATINTYIHVYTSYTQPSWTLGQNYFTTTMLGKLYLDLTVDPNWQNYVDSK